MITCRVMLPVPSLSSRLNAASSASPSSDEMCSRDVCADGLICGVRSYLLDEMRLGVDTLCVHV